MKKIGIIGAMELEVEELKSQPDCKNRESGENYRKPILP